MSVSDIALLGVGQTIYEPEKKQSIPEMVYEAVTRSLSDSGIGMSEIENI